MHRLSRGGRYALGILTGALALTLAWPASAGEPPAPEPEYSALGGGAETEVITRYLWRGFQWSRHEVWQSSLWLTWKQLELGLWTNGVLKREAQHGHINELDYSAAYRHQLGRLEISPTYRTYNYFHQPYSPSTGELGVELSYDLGAGFSAISNHAYDVDEYHGYFAELGLAWEREYASGDSITIQGTLGIGSGRFNQAYALVRTEAVNVLQLDLGWTHQLGAGVYLRPHLTLSTIPDGRLRRVVRGTDNVVVGFVLGAAWD